MKAEKKAEQIKEKIKVITDQKVPVLSSFVVHDNSVQSELRLSASWSISIPVDEIHYPKSLAPTSRTVPGEIATRQQITPAGMLWQQMYDLAEQIHKCAHLSDRRIPEGYGSHPIPINYRTKTGPERRREAKALWIIDTGRRFLSDYRRATNKRNLARIRKQITGLQAQQKTILPQLRECNSKYLSGKKTEREAQAAKSAEALKSGRFWEADKDTLKGYFQPPFDKNYLADVSEKWRAALFCECKSISYKWGNGNWGHKLGGTGRGYLCGIDDNGDKWGHRLQNLPQSHDDHGNLGLDSTVEEAMSELFEIEESKLVDCQRQGDLLFCSTKIRTENGPEKCENCGNTRDKHFASVTDDGQPLLSCEEWEPRESHKIASPGMERNGRYFRSPNPIEVTHTSHPTVILPPGEYRLYELRIADAD
jgi:hypothetical protein